MWNVTKIEGETVEENEMDYRGHNNFIGDFERAVLVRDEAEREWLRAATAVIYETRRIEANKPRPIDIESFNRAWERIRLEGGPFA